MTLQQLKYALTIADCGSMNEAAKKLFVSQPNLSATVREVEEEAGITIFLRNNRGITVTAEGEEFLGYAKQVVEQYHLLENRYLNAEVKQKFSVSMQHYSFAVKAFVQLAKEVGMDEYEFAVHETQTEQIIKNVRDMKSEIGVLYLSDFNQKVLIKLFKEYNLEFTELFECDTYVYMWNKHPLAEKSIISIDELEEYPCLAFEQGEHNSFYFSEEIFSDFERRKNIRVRDRATLFNLLIGLNGYTVCSGVIDKKLNGKDIIAVPLADESDMRIGYITHRKGMLSRLGTTYLEALQKYLG